MTVTALHTPTDTTPAPIVPWAHFVYDEPRGPGEPRTVQATWVAIAQESLPQVLIEATYTLAGDAWRLTSGPEVVLMARASGAVFEDPGDACTVAAALSVAADQLRRIRASEGGASS